MAMEPDGRPSMREVEAQLAQLLARPRRSRRRGLVLLGQGLPAWLCCCWAFGRGNDERRPRPSCGRRRWPPCRPRFPAPNPACGGWPLLPSVRVVILTLAACCLLLSQPGISGTMREAAVRALSELGDNGAERALCSCCRARQLVRILDDCGGFRPGAAAASAWAGGARQALPPVMDPARTGPRWRCLSIPPIFRAASSCGRALVTVARPVGR